MNRVVVGEFLRRRIIAGYPLAVADPDATELVFQQAVDRAARKPFCIVEVRPVIVRIKAQPGISRTHPESRVGLQQADNVISTDGIDAIRDELHGFHGFGRRVEPNDAAAIAGEPELAVRRLFDIDQEIAGEFAVGVLIAGKTLEAASPDVLVEPSAVGGNPDPAPRILQHTADGI